MNITIMKSPPKPSDGLPYYANFRSPVNAIAFPPSTPGGTPESAKALHISRHKSARHRAKRAASMVRIEVVHTVVHTA
ncbi:MAG: hypothetical protein KIT14_20430 [bacterium]|nr:hypothetical protein [bacterium]